jgi:hypothetical protein
LQRQTEKRADENDQSQDEHILHCGRDDDGPDDVASDKELETEQNCASHVLPIKLIVFAGVLRAMEHKSPAGDERTACDNKYTHAIHAGANDFHNPPKLFHDCLIAGKRAAFQCSL